jgi:hypothetical protein
LFPHLAPLPKAPVIDSAAIARDIAWFAADDRDGRAIGSEGLRQASHYLAEGFEAAGFAKGGDGDSFFRELEMPVSAKIESADFSIQEEALVRTRDFDAFLTSDSGSAMGEVVFVGYGITDPEHDYDDYEDVDV